ncbi:T9SS type B sorting domain-containing protein, partial [Pontibacter sp. HJ8]
APYTYSINGTTFQSNTNFTGLASGEYTLTVKDANGCQVNTAVAVSKNGPASFASVTVASSCGRDNGSITVTSVSGGATPYTYSLNGGTFQSAASFAGLTAGAYTVTVKDANGCTHAETITVTDIAGPSDLTASAQSSTCGNSNGGFTISGVTGGAAPYTYSINGTNFQSSASFTALAAGEYPVTVKDANGCTFTKTVTVTNTTGPAGFTMTAKSATCGGSNGSVAVSQVTGGTAPYTYSKDGTTFQSSASLTGLAAGTHTITVKDANGCTFTRSAVIGNIAGPTAYELAATASTCGAANGTITASGVTGGTAPYTYSLNGGTFQNNAAFASVAAGEYTLTVKDANGCTLDKKVVVGDVAGPAGLTAAATPASCKVNDGTITAGQVSGGTAPYTYSLDGTSFQASNRFINLAAGEYQVYAKDANGCSTSTTVTVGAKGPKEATITSAKATCGENNGSITVTAVTGGVAPYTYSINGGAFQSSATFAKLAVGTYEVTIRDAEGCTITKMHNVVNNGGVESFTVTGTDASCGESNGRIGISQITGGQSPYTYSLDGATFKSEPAFAGLAAGTYQVSVKDASGCTRIETVTLANSPALTNVKVTTSPVGCGQSAGQVTISEVTGGTSPYAYSLDGLNFSSSATLRDVAPGSYTLIVKDAKGCTFSAPVTVGKFDSKLAYVRHITCFGETNGVIAISATGKDVNTEYSIDNGKTFGKDSVFSNLPKGIYQVITRFSPTCSVTIGSVEIQEPKPLQVAVTPGAGSIGKPNSASAAVTAISGGTGPYTYQLDNGQFGADSIFTDLRGGEHRLVVKDKNGCTTEVVFQVESLGELDIPNGFTPNGDGNNDRWVIRNLSVLYPDCRVTVYNRWGSPVFESKGYAKEWDGTHNGKRLPDGTYYSIIEFGDSRPALKTSVTIMR